MPEAEAWSGRGGAATTSATQAPAPRMLAAKQSHRTFLRWVTSPIWQPSSCCAFLRKRSLTTDSIVHENWNRYYDPSTGRWLQPEPLLQSPDFAIAMAHQGMSTPTYAYAANNPIHFADANGLTITVNWGSDPQTVVNIANAIARLRSTETGRTLYDRLDARPETITVSHQQTYLDFSLKRGKRRKTQVIRVLPVEVLEAGRGCAGETRFPRFTAA